MMQNARVTAFNVFELLRENQQEGKIAPQILTQIRVNIVFTELRKAVGLLRKLNSILPRAALVRIFKTFVRPHLAMVISCTIKLLIVSFMISWNQFSIINA